MAYEAIIYEKKGNIAWVTLNRPERLNAISRTMHEELYDVWHNVFMKDDDVRVAILTGAGEGFCAGGDMKDYVRRDEAGEAVRYGPNFLSGYLDPVEINKPIVCAVNGVCAAGGLRLLGGCDVIICSENAEFLDTHVSIGWSPFPVAMAMLGRMPFGAVMRMVLMGRADRMSAQRAYELGLVSEIVPQDKLLERASQIAQAIAEQAPVAVRMIKEVMNKIVKPRAEAIEQAHLRVGTETEDATEGLRAYAAKRPPAWKGK